MTGFLKRIEGKHGAFLVLPKDVYVGRSLEVYGEWCEREVTLFTKIVKPGMTVVELGANIGSHTVPLAKMVGPTGRVYAVELQPFVAQVLSANVLMNGLDWVRVVQAGVHEENASFDLAEMDYRVAHNFGGVSLEKLQEQSGRSVSQRVQVGPLDQMLRLDRLDFLKLDVEHLEASALRGARALIEKFQPAIYLENDVAAESQEILDVLHGLGYKAFWHVSPLFMEDNFAGHKEDVFGNVACVNVLAVPEARNVVGMTRARSGADHPKIRR